MVAVCDEDFLLKDSLMMTDETNHGDREMLEYLSNMYEKGFQVLVKRPVSLVALNQLIKLFVKKQ